MTQKFQGSSGCVASPLRNPLTEAGKKGKWAMTQGSNSQTSAP